MLVRLSLAALLATAAHATLLLSDAKLSIIDPISSSARVSTTFSHSTPASLEPSPFQLLETDHLKLAFALKDDDGNPLQPLQAALVWTPVGPDTGLGQDHVQSIKVNKRTGKAKWDLHLAQSPSSLLTLPSPLSLTLLLAHPAHPPLSLPLGVFTLPSSLALPSPFPPNEDLPRNWEVETFGKQEELKWTNRLPERRTGWVKAVLGTAVVASPWLVFIGALLPLLPALRPSLPSPTTLLFLALIFTLESSFALYWLNLTGNLLQTLPVFGALAVASAVVGRGALGEVRRRRLGGKKRE